VLKFLIEVSHNFRCHSLINVWLAQKFDIFFAHFQRYHYYITQGIDSRQLAGPPPGQMERIEHSLPEKLRENQDLATMLSELKDEVLSAYDFSYRQSISEYACLTARYAFIDDHLIRPETLSCFLRSPTLRIYFVFQLFNSLSSTNLVLYCQAFAGFSFTINFSPAECYWASFVDPFVLFITA